MSYIQSHTKEGIRHHLNEVGFEKARIDRALRVYEANYAIYDVTTIREIIYQLSIRDKLKQWKQSNQTMFYSRIQARKALKTFDVHDYYIEGALKQYEKQQISDNNKTLYDMEEIIEIVSQLRSVRTPHQKQNELSIAIGATPVQDIEIDGFTEYTADVTTPGTPKSVTQDIQSIQSPMSPEGGHIHTQITPQSQANRNSPYSFAVAHQQIQHKQQQQIQQQQHQHIQQHKMVVPPERQHQQHINKHIQRDKKMKDKNMNKNSNKNSNKNMNKKHIRNIKHNANKLQLEYIEKEIIMTEKSYNDGLNILLNDLILPIFEHKYIDRKYYNKIISTIPNLIEFHTEFLTELNTAYNSKHKSLSRVFNRYILENQREFINIYLKYICDYNNILDIFGTRLHGNKLLNQYLKNKRKEKKSLYNYLILPIQRVPRYILLLKDLKKYTSNLDKDYENIENAIIIITEITETINSQQKRVENMRKCIEIQDSLHGLKHPIVDQNNIRKYENNFVFIDKETNHQRIFYIFNDIVIMANNKKKVKYVLDIRTIDIKMDTSYTYNNNYSEDTQNDEKSNEFIEFTLITGITKPMIFFSDSISNISKMQTLIETNRYGVWTQDLKDNSNDNTQSKSQSDSLQNHLVRQLALVL
eukprot:297214_1